MVPSRERIRLSRLPAYPSLVSVCLHPSCPRYQRHHDPDQCRDGAAHRAPPFEQPSPLYPRGPRSGPGYIVPVHHHLFDPIRPSGRRTAISLLAYTQCPRLAGAPEATHQRFRAFAKLSLSACRSLRPREVRRLSYTQFHCRRRWPCTLMLRVRHSRLPHKSASCGIMFSRLYRFAHFATTCGLACLPGGPDTAF